jgi:hypothetical protein
MFDHRRRQSMKDRSNVARTPETPNDAYRGPERRRHRVFVTRNTEYHFRDGFCIAVRDRRTGDFLEGHLALHRRVNGGLRFFPNGGILPNGGDPKPGESLYFANDAREPEGESPKSRELVTSPLESVERPSRDLVEAYPSRRKR